MYFKNCNKHFVSLAFSFFNLIIQHGSEISGVFQEDEKGLKIFIKPNFVGFMNKIQQCTI